MNYIPNNANNLITMGFAIEYNIYEYYAFPLMNFKFPKEKLLILQKCYPINGDIS